MNRNDALTPIAPARIKVLLLPAGPIKRSKFAQFIERLDQENVVRLGDVSPDARPNRNMFSPLAFPDGKIIYHLTTSTPPASRSTLTPFELFREPLMVVGIADDEQLRQSGGLDGADGTIHDGESEAGAGRVQILSNNLEDLKERFPRALTHRLVIFDVSDPRVYKDIKDSAITVPPLESSTRTTMKTLMCDLSSVLLAEYTSYARSLQELSSIDSPNATQNERMTNDTPWASTQGPFRRNSQFSLQSSDSRSSSPGVGPDGKEHHRMSMPAVLPSGTGQSHSTSPAPPTTFDEITRSHSQVGSPLDTTVSRSSAGATARESSQERVSVQGFGSGSLTERARNKGKGRVSVVLGSLYLSAGRWNDALRELVEGATAAKANSDYLWHGKSLENILVCLIMLAWAQMSFQIPRICYPIAHKSLSSTISPHPPSRSQSAPDGDTTHGRNSVDRSASLQELCLLIPDLLNNILNLYTRAADLTGEALPQIAFSESVIRYSKLLTAVHLFKGKLDDDALQGIVLGLPRTLKLTQSRINVMPTRSEITSILFRAMPSSGTDLSVIDRSIILTGVASVLSTLGLHRKKALVLRELVTILIQGLVQARKAGAAEVGIHPAAGLTALSTSQNGGVSGAFDLAESDIESGVTEVLDALGKAYGVTSAKGSVNDQSAAQSSTFEHQSEQQFVQNEYSNETIILRVISEANIRSFGSLHLKLNVLRACISLCEALPDFQGVLHFTAELLRTSGSGVAPGVKSSLGACLLPREEQIRMANNISRTVAAAKKLGLQNIEAEYWDEFLVRGIEFVEPVISKAPIPHTKNELERSGVSDKEKSPFIYNPFLKKPSKTAIEKILTAGEQAEIKITLQNLYEFEIEIERIQLESEGVELRSDSHATNIGPYRIQNIMISCTPEHAGSLVITGCIIKLRGCRERRFPIFSEPWYPHSERKMKGIGLAAFEQQRTRPTSTLSLASKRSSVQPSGPKALSLSFTVISEQPILTVKATHLPQAALMLLEGEKRVFKIEVQNKSSYLPVDLVLLSFQDSTSGPLQAAMSKKDIPPTELYELEILYSQKQALRWLGSDETLLIGPGQTHTFEVEILGKPGLVNGSVQIDYAHLGKRRSELSEKFFTRQISVPFTTTVNASIELSRVDILPYSGDSKWVKQLQKISRSQEEEDATEKISAETSNTEYCLLLLDLRNVWPQPLTATLSLSASSNTSSAYTVSETIQPGHTSRIILPIQRVFLSNPHAPIPTLNPANARQFVVSASNISPEAERAVREAFWYREEILQRLRGVWTEPSSGRKGDIELRGIRLSNRMVDALRIEDLDIEMRVESATSAVTTTSPPTVQHTSPTRFDVLTDELLVLATRVTNRTSQPIRALLRTQPSLRHQPHSAALDLSRRLLWHGTPQRALPLLPPGGSIEVRLGLCALARGEFEVGASVEEIVVRRTPEEEADKVDLLADMVLGQRERRTWHARHGCVIFARDGEEM